MHSARETPLEDCTRRGLPISTQCGSACHCPACCGTLARPANQRTAAARGAAAPAIAPAASLERILIVAGLPEQGAEPPAGAIGTLPIAIGLLLPRSMAVFRLGCTRWLGVAHARRQQPDGPARPMLSARLHGPMHAGPAATRPTPPTHRGGLPLKQRRMHRQHQERLRGKRPGQRRAL
jgi:hypothetical protein